jgi:predicted nuclease of predicted toxin-antitoxin system
VRLLLDANLSPKVARRLNDSGHDATHIVEIGLMTVSDPEIMRAAAEAVACSSPLIQISPRCSRWAGRGRRR